MNSLVSARSPQVPFDTEPSHGPTKLMPMSDGSPAASSILLFPDRAGPESQVSLPGRAERRLHEGFSRAKLVPVHRRRPDRPGPNLGRKGRPPPGFVLESGHLTRQYTDQDSGQKNGGTLWVPPFFCYIIATSGTRSYGLFQVQVGLYPAETAFRAAWTVVGFSAIGPPNGRMVSVTSPCQGTKGSVGFAGESTPNGLPPSLKKVVT